MSKSEKINLKGRELANRLAGISTPIGGISWKPPVDERGKAQCLLVYLAGQRALHYPYDREIGSFGARLDNNACVHHGMTRGRSKKLCVKGERCYG